MNISKLSPEQKKWAAEIWDEAERQGVNPRLATAIAFRESSFNPGAANTESSAKGLGQAIKGTRERYGIDPNNPQSQVQGLVKHIADLSKRYNGDEAAIIIGYKQGEKYGDLYKEGGFNALKDKKYLVNGVEKSVYDDVRDYGGKVWDSKQSLDAQTSTPSPSAGEAPAATAEPEGSVTVEGTSPLYSEEELKTGALAAAPGAAAGAGIAAAQEGVRKAGDFFDKRSAIAAIAQDAPPEIKAKGADAVSKWANALYKDTGYVGGGHYKEAAALAREAGDFGKSVKSAVAGTGIDPTSPFFQNTKFNPAQQAAAQNVATGKVSPAVLGETPKGVTGGSAEPGFLSSKAKETGQFLKGAGGTVGRIGLKGLAGAGTVLSAADAYDAFKQGDYIKGAVDVAGAVGGALTFVPGIGPVIGVPLSLAPLVYDVAVRTHKNAQKNFKENRNTDADLIGQAI